MVDSHLHAAIIVPMENILEPTGNDVLSGRGVTTNRHPGNVSYRSLVALNKELYVTSTKKQKMAISRSIVDAVRSMTPPGRFLDKDPETGLWHDIGDRKAIEKTSQALRDGAADLRKQLSQDLGDPDFLNAVFEDEMDVSSSSSNAGTTTTNDPDSGEKEQPKATTPQDHLKKAGHRRTRSNPNTLAEKKTAVFSKKRKPELMEQVPKPHLSPLNSIGSQSPSPMVDRSTFGRAASFDYAYPYNQPPTPPPPPGTYYPHHTPSGPSLKSVSFDSGHRAHSWNYYPGHRPPLSPSTLPGRHHPHSPPPHYSRPPMSPPHQSWSPGGYPRSTPPYRSWHTSPSPYAYPPGDLSVPTLGRNTSDSTPPRVPLSPVLPTPTSAQDNHLYRPPLIMRAGSAEDFLPPPSPGGFAKHKEEKIIIAKPIQESNEMVVDETDEIVAPSSSSCNLFGCFLMDTEEDESKTGIEVVLSGSDDTDEADPADDEGKTETFSPLPFLRKEVETPTSFFETLLQLPIAPCAPQDVE